MYGRAINVALEFPYLVNCLCCYVCQPCRRKEVGVKMMIKNKKVGLFDCVSRIALCTTSPRYTFKLEFEWVSFEML